MVALQASMRKSNEWKRYFDTTPAELSGFWSLALDLDKSYRTHRFMVDVCCCGASFAVVVTHVVFVVVVVVVTAPGFRCDPTAVSPGTLRLCRKGACSVAIASSSTIQSLSSFFSLLLSQLLLLVLGGRRTWARINVLCKSGMDRTSVCMARQSMLPSSTYSTSSCAITNHHEQDFGVREFVATCNTTAANKNTNNNINNTTNTPTTAHAPSGTTCTQKSECTLLGSSAYRTSSQPNCRPECTR